MIAVYQVSSFRAVRRELSSLFCNPSRFFRLVFPIHPRPVRPLSYEFRLNESPRRFHRFPPIMRSASDARITQTPPLVRALKWNGEFIGCISDNSCLLYDSCVENVSLIYTASRRATIAFLEVTKLICNATRWIVLYALIYIYTSALVLY